MRGRWTCETEKINPINEQPTNHSVLSLKANKFHCRGLGTKRLSEEGKRSTPKSPLFPNLIHDVAREYNSEAHNGRFQEPEQGAHQHERGEYVIVFFLLDDLSEHIYTGGERSREGGEMFKYISRRVLLGIGIDGHHV